jgi:hypothetical protein
MIKRALWVSALAFPILTGRAFADDAAEKVDILIEKYTRAIGGRTAIDRIQTREVEAKQHKGPKLLYYWQKPDKVLLVEGKQKIGFDGGSGWMLSKKKRVTRLPKGSQLPLEQDANPIRYVRLRSLYSDLQAAPPESVGSRQMNVLVAPNELGSTKFYFDAETHLLTRIEETGERSAYYEHSTEFSNYQDVDGIKFPFRIVHTSTEPGGPNQEIRISKVTQNIELKPGMFEKPSGVTVTLGGKR